jgi:hypothetical protein
MLGPLSLGLLPGGSGTKSLRGCCVSLHVLLLYGPGDPLGEFKGKRL